MRTIDIKSTKPKGSLPRMQIELERALWKSDLNLDRWNIVRKIDDLAGDFSVRLMTGEALNLGTLWSLTIEWIIFSSQEWGSFCIHRGEEKRTSPKCTDWLISSAQRMWEKHHLPKFCISHPQQPYQPRKVMGLSAQQDLHQRPATIFLSQGTGWAISRCRHWWPKKGSIADMIPMLVQPFAKNFKIQFPYIFVILCAKISHPWMVYNL